MPTAQGGFDTNRSGVSASPGGGNLNSVLSRDRAQQRALRVGRELVDFQTSPIAIKPIAEGFHLALKGSIHTNTSWIEREFDQIVAKKPKVVQLDLTGSEYISSVGLGILVNLHNRIKAGGGTLTIVKMLKRTKGIFRAAYLDRLFAIAPEAVIELEEK